MLAEYAACQGGDRQERQADHQWQVSAEVLLTRRPRPGPPYESRTEHPGHRQDWKDHPADPDHQKGEDLKGARLRGRYVEAGSRLGRDLVRLPDAIQDREQVSVRLIRKLLTRLGDVLRDLCCQLLAPSRRD